MRVWYLLLCCLCSVLLSAAFAQPVAFSVTAAERARVITAARRYLNEAPRTVTAAQSPRSAGGLHDFFSEGDYWWPDPNNPDGPYIQRDGMTNPDNFVAHPVGNELVVPPSGGITQSSIPSG